jgi:DNA-binding NarL/FixJ family response regulator
VEEALATARAATSEDAITAAMQEGAELDADGVVALVRAPSADRRRPRFGWDSITPTEDQVIAEIVAGRSNPDIADALSMSRETVKTHVSSILRKLGLASRTELAAQAARRDRYA